MNNSHPSSYSDTSFHYSSTNHEQKKIYPWFAHTQYNKISETSQLILPQKFIRKILSNTHSTLLFAPRRKTASLFYFYPNFALVSQSRYKVSLVNRAHSNSQTKIITSNSAKFSPFWQTTLNSIGRENHSKTRNGKGTTLLSSVLRVRNQSETRERKSNSSFPTLPLSRARAHTHELIEMSTPLQKAEAFCASLRRSAVSRHMADSVVITSLLRGWWLFPLVAL